MNGEADLRSWIGRTEEAWDSVLPGQVDGMAATLDRPDPPAREGDRLPPMWHRLLFLPRAPKSEIGPDGHPKRGGFLPPVELPRRMFAGARYFYQGDLRVGDKVRLESRIADVQVKNGNSGTLVFVNVNYCYYVGKTCVLEKQQDIVYRDDPDAERSTRRLDAPTASPDPSPEWRATIEPDPVTLFRYSALTFNGHRIHYDRTYATEVEGYPGLVVHGPLTATYLSELLRANTGDRPLARFAFRAKRPLFDTAPFDVVGGLTNDGGSAWLAALTPDGAIAVEAEADFAAPDSPAAGAAA